jgi:hypothetical protein
VFQEIIALSVGPITSLKLTLVGLFSSMNAEVPFEELEQKFLVSLAYFKLSYPYHAIAKFSRTHLTLERLEAFMNCSNVLVKPALTGECRATHMT